VFPSIYKKIGHYLETGAMLLVEGSIEERDEKKQFIIRDGKPLEDIPHLDETFSTVYLRLEMNKQTKEQLTRLKEIIKQHKGDKQVVLYYEGSDKTLRLGDDERVSGLEVCLLAFKKLLGEHNVIMK
jgi:DNA polymerase-3 subunit alpha